MEYTIWSLTLINPSLKIGITRLEHPIRNCALTRDPDSLETESRRALRENAHLFRGETF